jgi:outer membrane lipoprotein-sorting protein
MKCNFLNDRLADLFDETISPIEKESLMLHVNQCSECAAEYERYQQASASLTPRSQIKASNPLNVKLMKTTEISNNTKKSRAGFARSRWFSSVSIAAVLILAVGILFLAQPGAFRNEARAAEVLLNKSFAAMLNLKSMIVHFRVRSIPGDNMDLIDLNGRFVDYTVWREFGQPGKWRMEKEGMVVAMDGTHQYSLMEKSGQALMGQPGVGFIGWIRIFLDPQNILEVEKKEAGKNNNTYTLENKADETILTVEAKALGDFRNSYLLNKTIDASNNRRIYHFDKVTNRLKSAEIFVVENGREVKVLELDRIQYDAEIPASQFVISLPQGAQWVEVSDLSKRNEPAKVYKTPEEVAKAFFDAMTGNDWNTVFILCPVLENASKIDRIKSYYGGLTVVSLGKPFQSGQFPGYFIPYEIRLKSGEVNKHNLAVRNDNPAKSWMVDGGF